MQNRLLEAAVEERLISKKQYQRIADELLGDPDLDVAEVLVGRSYITQDQLNTLTILVGVSYEEEISTGKEAAVDLGGQYSSAARRAMEMLNEEEAEAGLDSAEELERRYKEELEASRQQLSTPAAPPRTQATPASVPPSSGSVPRVAAQPAQPPAQFASKPTPAADPAAPKVPTVSVDEARDVYGKIKRLKDFLTLARQWGASDLHVCVDKPVFVRINGGLRYLEMPPLSAEFAEQLNFQLLNEEQREILCEKLNLDYALQLDGLGRHRCNVFHQRLGWNGVYRIIPNDLPTIEGLGLPQVCKDLTDHHQGMVLVTGPKGSGKSTTVAAMINFVNKHRDDHVITVEDPIEYVHKPIKCQMTMRQMGTHSANFGMALRAALREDPDIILVGELRNHETISIALSAAETGHLVFGTLHTGNAARTVSRILDVYPIKQREQITTMISESMRGIISQQLIPKKDKSGLALALEILIITQGVSSIIKEGKFFQLVSLMQSGKKVGMCTMDDSIAALFRDGVISGREAYTRAENKQLYEAAKDEE
jgi:twitching motility protein PilT